MPFYKTHEGNVFCLCLDTTSQPQHNTHTHICTHIHTQDAGNTAAVTNGAVNTQTDKARAGGRGKNTTVESALDGVVDVMKHAAALRHTHPDVVCATVHVLIAIWQVGVCWWGGCGWGLWNRGFVCVYTHEGKVHVIDYVVCSGAIDVSRYTHT